MDNLQLADYYFQDHFIFRIPFLLDVLLEKKMWLLFRVQVCATQEFADERNHLFKT